jgi:hypothetical protein
MALVITVALLKGGVSKTTGAVALAEAAALSVPTVLIDTDRQGSAIRWAELAARGGHPLRAEVVWQASTDLSADVRSASRRAAVIAVDTAPPGDMHAIERAVKVADQVVMPVPPNLAGSSPPSRKRRTPVSLPPRRSPRSAAESRTAPRLRPGLRPGGTRLRHRNAPHRGHRP